MSGINYDDWDVNLREQTAKHSCGFTLSVEGPARNPSAVHPGPFPKHLSALEQVRLLRHGVEALAKAAKKSTVSRPPAKPAFNPDRPKKTLLTLRRKEPLEETR